MSISLDPQGSTSLSSLLNRATPRNSNSNSSKNSAANADTLTKAKDSVDVTINYKEGRKQWAREEVDFLKKQIHQMAIIQLLDAEQYADVISGLSDRLEGAASAYAGGDTNDLKDDAKALSDGIDELAAAQNGTGTAQTPATASTESTIAKVEDARLESLANYSAAQSEYDRDQSFSNDVKSLSKRLRTLFDMATEKAEAESQDSARLSIAKDHFANTQAHTKSALKTIAGWSSPPTTAPTGTPIQPSQPLSLDI
jgi:hypothetical protein